MMNAKTNYGTARSRVAGQGSIMIRRIRLIGLLMAVLGAIALAGPAGNEHGRKTRRRLSHR